MNGAKSTRFSSLQLQLASSPLFAILIIYRFVQRRKVVTSEALNNNNKQICNFATLLRITCPGLWDHIMLPATLQRWQYRLRPSKASTRLSDPGWMQSWVDLGQPSLVHVMWARLRKWEQRAVVGPVKVHNTLNSSSEWVYSSGSVRAAHEPTRSTCRPS